MRITLPYSLLQCALPLSSDGPIPLLTSLRRSFFYFYFLPDGLSLLFPGFVCLDLFALNFPPAISQSAAWLSLGHLLSLSSLDSQERELDLLTPCHCQCLGGALWPQVPSRLQASLLHDCWLVYLVRGERALQQPMEQNWPGDGLWTGPFPLDGLAQSASPYLRTLDFPLENCTLFLKGHLAQKTYHLSS